MTKMEYTDFSTKHKNLRKCSITESVELAYLEKGAGQPVVFIHGSMTDLYTWHLQLEPFSQHYHAIAYSRRNHYPNSWVAYPAKYSLKEQADDLVKFIQAVGLTTPVHLIGSSYGANIAMFAAFTRPRLVRNLVLCEPPVFSLFVNDPTFAAGYHEFKDKIAKRLLAEDKEGAVTVFFNYVMGTEMPFDQIPFEHRARMLQNVRTVESEDYTFAFSYDDLRLVNTPILLVNGDQSPPQFICAIETISRCFPNSERATIKSASHAMHYEKARAFNAVVLRFLARHQ